MEPLVYDSGVAEPGLHESWSELAEHALTHDDLPPVPAAA
jgi:hypothetical protein